MGAGLSGSCMANLLANDGNEVTIVEKEKCIGGNCRDGYYKNTLIHFKGPHYFRSDSPDVIRFLTQFTSWHKVGYRIKTFVDGELYPFPINAQTINKFFKTELNERGIKMFLSLLREDGIARNASLNSQNAIICKCGILLYEKFFLNYTIKQWGMHPKDLDASVCNRIPIRTNNNDLYFDAQFQAMPQKGYTEMFRKMLDHKNITLKLNKDVLKIKYEEFDHWIWTGKIDEFFSYRYGKLPYRSLKFKFKEFKQRFHQEVVQVNYPNDKAFTRKVEIKHVTGQRCKNTIVSYEYPQKKGEPYYPIPTKENQELYLKYKKEADKEIGVSFIGRLGTYTYLNMDQCVSDCLKLFEKLKRGKKDE